jgi:hypothetical protein
MDSENMHGHAEDSSNKVFTIGLAYINVSTTETLS